MHCPEEGLTGVRQLNPVNPVKQKGARLQAIESKGKKATCGRFFGDTERKIKTDVQTGGPAACVMACKGNIYKSVVGNA